MYNIYKDINFKSLIKDGTPFAFQYLTGLRKVKLVELMEQLEAHVNENYKDATPETKKKLKNLLQTSPEILEKVIRELDSQGKITIIEPKKKKWIFM